VHQHPQDRVFRITESAFAFSGPRTACAVLQPPDRTGCEDIPFQGIHRHALAAQKRSERRSRARARTRRQQNPAKCARPSHRFEAFCGFGFIRDKVVHTNPQESSQACSRGIEITKIFLFDHRVRNLVRSLRLHRFSPADADIFINWFPVGCDDCPQSPLSLGGSSLQAARIADHRVREISRYAPRFACLASSIRARLLRLARSSQFRRGNHAANGDFHGRARGRIHPKK